jgi:uncharacterized protein YdeI (YjbR/CyaY-like superfamily)
MWLMMNTRKKEDLKEVPFIVVYTVNDWRNWLEKNHLKEKKVGMISYKKHTGKGFISHRDAMEEAICFGWIDTTINRLDDNRFVRYFVKRGDKANWSKNTLSYGKKLMAEGRMSEHGVMRYKQGLMKKPHDYGIPNNPRMPGELKDSLIKDKKAMKNFEDFAPSTKKMFYRWILRAKTKETRMKRVDDVVKSALDNDTVLR